MALQGMVQFLRAVLLASFALSSVVLANNSEIWVSQLNEAKTNQQPIPNLSQMGVVDLASAYRVQTAFVRECQTHDEIAGFKASLTTREMQSLFNIHRPLFGVLLKNGNLTHHPTLSLKTTHRLEIETELGFIFKTTINKPVVSVKELKKAVAAVVPVMEIPDVGFQHYPINAIDLVAGNTGSFCYLIKRDVNWLDKNLRHISVTLFHDGEIVNQGQANDALGDQWEALRWLVNQVVAEGWTIKPGYIMMTGALGESIVAQPGKYTARFNEGNVLTLNVE